MNLEQTLLTTLQTNMEDSMVPIPNSVSGEKNQQRRQENKYRCLHVVFLHLNTANNNMMPLSYLPW